MVYRVNGPSRDERALEREGWIHECAVDGENLGKSVLEILEEYSQVAVIKVRERNEEIYHIRRKDPSKDSPQ